MEGAETNESTYPTLTGGGDLSAATEILENVRQKLQNTSPKLKQLARKAASRLDHSSATCGFFFNRNQEANILGFNQFTDCRPN